MKGTIHRQLLKEYPTQIQVGTVLVLRQVCDAPSLHSHALSFLATPS